VAIALSIDRLVDRTAKEFALGLKAIALEISMISRQENELSVKFLLAGQIDFRNRENDICHGTCPAEHGFSVNPDDQNSCCGKKDAVVRLGVRPDRIIALKMEQSRKQDTSARIVKQRGLDYAKGNRTHKKWGK
jgi:hypothetical protein